MGLKEWLIPQEKVFFLLLERESKNVLKGAEILRDLMDNYNDLAERRKALKLVEHETDEIVHEIYEKLNRTFITPIDQEDLTGLASRYDEVIDHIYAVANRLFLYEISEPTQEMKDFADIVVQAVTEIDNAFSNLKKINEREIEHRCIEVDRLENLADELLNDSVAKLFKTGDQILIMKLKEIYEFFEKVTDSCEDVCDTIRDIVIKHT